MSYKIDDWDECLQKFKFANKTVKDSFKMKKQIVKAYLYSHAVQTRGYTVNKFLYRCSPSAVNMPQYYKSKDYCSSAVFQSQIEGDVGCAQLFVF